MPSSLRIPFHWYRDRHGIKFTLQPLVIQGTNNILRCKLQMLELARLWEPRSVTSRLLRPDHHQAIISRTRPNLMIQILKLMIPTTLQHIQCSLLDHTTQSLTPTLQVNNLVQATWMSATQVILPTQIQLITCSPLLMINQPLPTTTRLTRRNPGGQPDNQQIDMKVTVNPLSRAREENDANHVCQWWDVPDGK